MRIMNKRASIAKNTTSLFVSRVMGSLTTVVLIAIIARKLDTEGFGRYIFALSVGAILGVIADFGLIFLIPRDVARRDSRFEEYIATGCVIKIVFSIVIFAVLILFLRYFYPPTVRYAIYAAFAMMALRGMVDFFASFFNAYERMHYSAVLFLMCNFGIFGISLFAIFTGVREAWVILAVQAAAMVFFVIAAFVLVFKVLRPKRLRISRQLCVATLRKTAPFGFFAIGGVVYFQIDNVLLSMFRSIEDVGFYQGALRLIMATEMLPLVLSSAIYPTISRVLKESKNDAITIVQKMMYLVLIIGLPIGVTLMMLAKPIVSLIFGDGYAAIASVLAIVAWLVPIRFCGHVLGTVLSASGNQKFRTWASWLAVGVNISLNLLLLPKYGYIGAAVTSISTSFFLVSFYYVVLCLRFHRFELLAVIARLAFPVAVLMIFLWLVGWLNVFVTAGMGLALYCIMLVPVGILTKNRVLAFGRLVLDKDIG